MWRHECPVATQNPFSRLCLLTTILTENTVSLFGHTNRVESSEHNQDWQIETNGLLNRQKSGKQKIKVVQGVKLVS